MASLSFPRDGQIKPVATDKSFPSFFHWSIQMFTLFEDRRGLYLVVEDGTHHFLKISLGYLDWVRTAAANLFNFSLSYYRGTSIRSFFLCSFPYVQNCYA